MTRKALAIVTCAMLLASLRPLRADAWEKDVHYGLTKWLAIQAGFSDSDAAVIGSADQGLDDGHFASAIWAVIFHVIMDGDPEGSRQIQKWHFPSDVTVPNPPEKRKVEHDSSAASLEAERIIGQPPPIEPEPAMLQDFGEALHPFQDSWSHEGIPGSPVGPPIGPTLFEIRPDLTWSHSVDRGGWYSHDADLTYLHPDQVEQMASRTFELLGRLLAKHPGLKHSPPRAWPDLVLDVQSFAAKDTKAGKADWFSNHGLGAEAQEISSQCDLPDGVPGAATTTGTDATGLLPVGMPNDQTGDAPDLRMVADFGALFWRPESMRIDMNFEGAHSYTHVSGGHWVSKIWLRSAKLAAEQQFTDPILNTVDAFCRNWIVTQNLPPAAELVDQSELRLQITSASLDDKATAQWLSRFLTLWLIQDHGLVNRLGHGDPSAPGYQRLPLQPSHEGQFRTLETSQFLGNVIEAGKDGHTPLVYQIVEAQPGWMGIQKPFVAFLHFKHTPHDAVILVLEKQSAGWRIVRIFPLVG